MNKHNKKSLIETEQSDDCQGEGIGVWVEKVDGIKKYKLLVIK